MIRRWLAALLILGCRSVRIAGNVVDQIRPSEKDPFVAAGIASDLGFERLDVLDNTVRIAEPLTTADGQEQVVASAALLIGDLPGSQRLFEVDGKLYLISASAILQWRPSGPASVTAVRGNHLDAAGDGPSALVATKGSCTFAENHCLLVPAAKQDPASAPIPVQLGVETLVLSGNHVFGPRTDAATAVSADISGTTIFGVPAITALGNITTGEIKVNNFPLQPPWTDLNIRLS